MSHLPHLVTPPLPLRTRHTFAAILLLLLVTAPWWWAVGCPFIDLDDLIAITGNPTVQAGLTPSSIAAAFTTATAGLWAPVTFLSLMLDVSLWGPGPAGMHATNVALHVANTLLVYALLITTTGRHGRALAVAALWSIHPLRAESVAWVFERKDVLSAFFGLLALLAWVRFTRARSTRAAAWYAAALLAWLLSLMCKPLLVTLPLLLLLLDLWPLQRTSLRWPRLLLEKALLALLALLFSLLTARIQAAQDILFRDPAYTLSQRLATIFGGYLRYLRDTFYPARLAIYYPDLQRIPLSTLLVGLVVVLGLTALAVACLQQRRRLAWPSAVGWLWFLLTLLPVIGIIQSGFQSRADRYTYFPSIGLIAALVWLPPDRWFVALPARRAAALAVTLAVALLASATLYRIALWRNPLQLYADGIAHTDHNFKLKYLMGLALQRAGRHAEAVDFFGEATLDMPTFPSAYNELGISLAALGRLHQAAEAFRRALALNPAHTGYRANYDRALHDLQARRDSLPATAP